VKKIGKWIAMAASACVMSACVSTEHQGGGGVADIRTLSNRADLVSGGDVLAEVRPAAGAPLGPRWITLNGGSDIAPTFKAGPDGALVGLVTGLRDGENKLSASVAGGGGMSLTITNHPRGGPVFSGPQLQPWICETEVSGLGPSIDKQCN